MSNKEKKKGNDNVQDSAQVEEEKSTSAVSKAVSKPELLIRNDTPIPKP